MKNNVDDTRNLKDPIHYFGLPITDLTGDDEFTYVNIKFHTSYRSPVWFRTNSYSLTLAMNAYGRYTTRTNVFDVKPGTFFFSNPDISRQLEWDELNEIHHLSFTERFLTKYAGVELFKTFPFLMFETMVPCHPDSQLFDSIHKIYLQIDRECHGNSPLKKKIIASLLTRLLLKIKQAFGEGYEIQQKESNDRDIVKSFISNLEHNYAQLLSGKTTRRQNVKEYANMQDIHENYLSSVIKEKTGKLPSHWIAEKTIFIAKSLLEDSSFSIKEISYRLGFTYVSYFTIFFKKHTTLTPKDFRILNKYT